MPASARSTCAVRLARWNDAQCSVVHFARQPVDIPGMFPVLRSSRRQIAAVFQGAMPRLLTSGRRGRRFESSHSDTRSAAEALGKPRAFFFATRQQHSARLARLPASGPETQKPPPPVRATGVL